MENRFRFRVWNGKEMLYNTGLGYGEGNQLIEDKGHIIMQCTGLKDKNEKLIYEGDIVKVPTQCNNELHGSYSLQEVVWRNGFWVLSYISSEKGHKLPRGWTACFMYYQWLDEDFDKEFVFSNDDFYCTYNRLEIIGNIYENEELLNGNKN